MSSSNFNIANSEKEIISFIKKNNFIEPIILGGGTNILFKNNIDRSILKIQIKGIELINETEDHVIISVVSSMTMIYYVCWIPLMDFITVEMGYHRWMAPIVFITLIHAIDMICRVMGFRHPSMVWDCSSLRYVVLI